ncbi:pseudouridine synthase [Mycena floridula]|nr:pseudouridine synthase [Mycena floridula]
MSIVFHERDQLDHDDQQRYSKRAKLDNEKIPEKEQSILPPSHSLLGIPEPISEGGRLKFEEKNVGISEYVGNGVSKIDGIIKQRFTDFLVFEVDLDGNELHIKSLAIPESPKKDPPAPDAMQGVETETPLEVAAAPVVDLPADSNEPWPEHFSTQLAPYLSESAITELKEIFLQGPEPPRVSDSGWGSRPTKSSEDADAVPEAPAAPETSSKRDRGGGRGGRGGKREDHRKVLSNPIESKPDRTALHQIVRQLPTLPPATTGEGSKIVIKWARGGRGGARGGGRGRDGRSGRGDFPPYIHFTLQKTNRDTQDAIQYLARLLHVNVKDLSVAGTKDKRGVTVQRVSLRRQSKTVEDIWKSGNGHTGQKSYDHALKKRAEHGIRISDLNYRKASLELGMLKGNAFVITLRNVQVDSMDTLDKALNTIKDGGFINYYGMQRFGTASIPTHSIGLALLKSEWQRAIDMILQTRYGEHPEVEAARNAWLVDGDLDRALALMPRRVVAERCILESYKKQGGDTRNAMGAFSTIPRNLRLMYVHAYQSYVWNAIVSERIRTFGCDKPVVGDLVLESASDAVDNMIIDVDGEILAPEEEKEAEKETTSSSKKSRKPWTPPQANLADRYREFLELDGLDPNNFVRKQKEYTLGGSYRKILHLPKELSWSVLRYTDPDVALAQADEDKLLGFDPPMVSDDGKFMALQIKLTLGTAAYATMAIREVTKTETSSHFQTGLTIASADQKFRGTDPEEKDK